MKAGGRISTSKPSNIVLGDMQKAFLIDISGTGGCEWDWLSPEMQLLLQKNCELVPADAPFEARIATDSWAYGQLLLSLAKIADSSDSSVGETLRDVAHGLMKEVPDTRISLIEGLSRLERPSSNSG
jgi:hypothetical protein